MKHRRSQPRDWRKVHFGIDAETLEIRAIEITGSRVGDAPILPDLLDQTPADQPLGIVTADGAYDNRTCHAAVAARGAAAVIPPLRNGKLWKEPTAGGVGAQRGAPQLPPPREGDLETLDRLSPTKLGRGQDGLLQTPERTHHVTRLRSSGCRASDQGRDPEPLHNPRNATHAARRIGL